ncbi:MAG TPA: hypothetical protein VNS10_07140 [Gemmatimonadaceae bacterium]|nr:hypothetical protein [Gemmatimonadaceae bacterium]
MSLGVASRPLARWLVASLIAAASACGRDVAAPRTIRSDGEPSYAKPATGFSLSSVTPDTASLSTTLDVQISGSGFVDGMVASWQLSGVADPTQVKTNSTRFVSNKQLIANITISGTATAAKWDVAIYSGGKTGIGSELGVLKQSFQVLDPTATFAIPLNDAGLSIRSDGLFSDGTSSLYTNGTCNIASKIFATTEQSNSGDAILNTGTTNGGGGKCGRRIRVVFPDGSIEVDGTFMNLRAIENTSYAIPIGATVARQLHIGTDQTPSDHSRCGGFVFGYGVANDVGAGSDSVWVTRIDARTWHAYSKAPPNNLAWCKNTGQLFPMTVDLTIIANRPLP